MFTSRGSKIRPGTTYQPRNRQGSPMLATFTGVAVGILFAVGTSMVVVALDTGQRTGAGPTIPVSSAPVPSKAPAAAPPVKSVPALPTPTAIAPIRNLPSGLYCRDLRTRRLSYAAAFQYWRLEGQPARMDSNRDGVPCETVYPTAAVNSFWRP